MRRHARPTISSAARCLALALLAATGRVAAASEDIVVVTLPPAAGVGERDVLIADLATVEGRPASVRERIGKLDLSDAMRPGQTVPFSQDQFRFRIQLAGFDSRQFRVEGARAVQATLTCCDVAERQIVAAAREFLASRIPGSPEDVELRELEPLRGPVRVVGRPEDVRLEPALRSGQSSLGRVRVDVAITTSGKKRVEVPVHLEARLYQSVAVATRRIARGQTLTEELVQFDRRAVENIAEYLTTTDSPIGERARRSIQPAQLITRADVEPATESVPVVVKQRDTVKLVARVGPLNVTTTGEALQDGRTGELIRVRNVDSKNVVQGRVVDRAVVEVLR